MTTQTLTLVFLAVYAIMMTCAGIYSFKRTKTMNDFLLGGRNIGAWMSAFAYGTSYFSAVLFIGYAGKTGWSNGLSGIWIGVGNAVIGSLLAWLFLAKRTRNMTHNLGASTMPELFRARYNSNGLKIFSALIIFIFLVPYSASVYMGLGYMFSTVFPNIPYNVWMLIIALLTAIYLVLGGYIATAITDFIQGIIMIIGVIAMVLFIVNSPSVGGFSAAFHKLYEIDPDLVSVFGGGKWFNLLSMIMLTSVGALGLPQMIHKFYAVKDDDSIKRATVISTLFALLIAGGAYFSGALSRLVLNNELPLTDGVPNYDAIMPNVLLNALSGSIAAKMVFGTIILLLLSASMSTLASIVLTSSSAITVDLASFSKRKEKISSMFSMRLVCLIFVLISYLFASFKVSFIIAIMSFSWGTVAGSFIGPYVYGLYWRGTTKIGAWAGMLSGFLTSILLICVTAITKGFSVATQYSPAFGVCAMIVSLIAVPLVSGLTPKFSKEFNDKIFALDAKG